MYETGKNCNGESGYRSVNSFSAGGTGLRMKTIHPTYGMRSNGMSDPTRNQRDFFLIVKISTALALGTMGAFLYSIKDISHDASLEFSPGTIIVFLVSAAAGWFFWTLVANLSEAQKR